MFTYLLKFMLKTKIILILMSYNLTYDYIFIYKIINRFSKLKNYQTYY